ncbi:MAG: exo-alpha-sialidase, partial [Blastocatellia bacterium]|nr:exo-alpha-sialidase [Blastocatellia bacterium]
MQKIAADIERPNRFYATTNNTATGGGFIFISDDGGLTWSPATKNLSVIRVKAFSILQDKQNPNTIYIGTNMGIYRSLDRGGSWSPIVGAAQPATTKPKTTKGKKTTKPAPTTAAAGPKKVPVLKDAVRALSYTMDDKNGILAAT